ncbi:hypothetical protein GCM10010978_28080 [Compostibacillus humi]|uniref:Uncharacterized protein n=1 Tax=Compostibacillus humi TaxID=1245525 RepID=A0A8J2XJ03_9BACI|nr:hypothetical protein GCM10010978_28080 [Compostibacillus humi]
MDEEKNSDDDTKLLPRHRQCGESDEKYIPSTPSAQDGRRCIDNRTSIPE